MSTRHVILVEYFLTDTSAFLFGIRSDFVEPDIVELQLDQEELRLFALSNFGEDNRVRVLKDSEERWHAYDRLIEPISRWAAPEDIVCLVPHGLLHYLPLHALKLEGKYLIERNPVVYCPSVSVLKLCQKQRKNNSDGTPARQTAIIFGDPHDDRLEARQQAERLAKIFNVEPLLRNDVTRDTFQKGVVGKDIVHFVGHGYFDKTEPLKSGLKLAGKEVLTAYDVFGLTGLKAHLVTLSGCETGINELRPGDELIGLMRAFLHAGTPSLLVSLWRVAQDSNAFLMERFYTYLRENPAMFKAEALRQAMLETKNRPDKPTWAFFYHWAPFVLIG